ncbi:M85 family metallopeptidase [Paraburkholderia azotifigens]|uniref:M85 family metallopeptidase n=1 Tax=Paraburkholderia azotifigens TaxID=2057004 RepID=UPI00316F13C3
MRGANAGARPVNASPTRERRDASAPPSESDAYADYVLSMAAQSPLTDDQYQQLRWAVVRTVMNSRGRLADACTTDMIANTILDALSRSPTFQAVVAYAMRHGGEELDHITYRNEYQVNWDASGELKEFRDMTAHDLEGHDGPHAPILPVVEAGRRTANAAPYVSVGVAPNADSPYLQSWQEGLLHELVHQLTGARDPVGPDARTHLGPTEILARRISQELGWSIPPFRGYEAPERERYLQERDLSALHDAANRNADHEHEFFERLDTISGGNEASRDFHEIEAAPSGPGPDDAHAGSGSLNRTDFSGTAPRVDDADMEVYHGAPYIFSFAHSAPTGYQTASAATGADCDTQGRFFEYGKPVGGNPHVREYDFPDGSKVVITAHEPQPADSDSLQMERGMTVAGTTALGAIGGFVLGGPPGAAAGAVAGASIGAGIASSNPDNRIWQGYTLQYYGRGDTKPFSTYYMYAWDSAPKRVSMFTALRNPDLWPDYADGKPDGSWNWWTWRSGDAPARS